VIVHPKMKLFQTCVNIYIFWVSIPLRLIATNMMGLSVVFNYIIVYPFFHYIIRMFVLVMPDFFAPKIEKWTPIFCCL